MNEYQRKFLRSRGYDPDDEAWQRNADEVVPKSAADAGRRHMMGSASYALDIAEPLAAGDLKKANKELQALLSKVREQAETLAYEALMKLQATEIISDTLSGDIVGNRKKGEKAVEILKKIRLENSKQIE